MTLPGLVRTPRLAIRRATRDLLLADLESPAALAAHAPVAPDWPPNHWDAGPIRWLLGKLEAFGDAEPFWWSWYIALAESGMIVGTVGFKGPPDNEGVVEIGYGVVTSHWRRGLATEACAAMLAWAAADPRVKGFRAHTLAGDPASAGVLLKNGFQFTRRLTDPDDGEVDRYDRPARE